MRLGLLAITAFLAAIPSAAHAQDDTRAHGIGDTLVLHYVGHAIGHEIYRLGQTSDGWTLVSDFDYRDRGRRTRVAGAMQLGRDFTPERLEIARVSDTG